MDDEKRKIICFEIDRMHDQVNLIDIQIEKLSNFPFDKEIIMSLISARNDLMKTRFYLKHELFEEKKYE